MSILLFLSFLCWQFTSAQQAFYTTQQGVVEFRSDAPLELIEARSEALRGVLDIQNREYAFSIAIHSFEGFNSPLQRAHFNENYLESDQYPKATYAGKIIEEVDLSTPGTYTIRTKGKLRIHGVEQERIIKSIVEVRAHTIEIQSDFTILLAEHNITVPKIVHQKIAEEIKVSISATLQPKP